VLSTFITGYEPRTQFAISLTAEQIFRAHNFSQLKLKRGSSGLKLKSSRQLVPRWVKELWWSIKEYNCSVEGQESTKVKFKRSKCSKQEAQRLRKHKLKPWQEVEKDSHGNWSTRKEAKGHNLNASQRPKASSKDQDTTSDMLSHLQTEISMISIFRIGRSVMEALSSWKCFNMPTHCNSDVFTTYGQDQDTGSAGDVLECPSHEIKSFKQSTRQRSKTQCRLDGCESLICIALKMVQ